MRDITEVRNYFKDDRFCTLNGVIIDSVTTESCICSLSIEDRHLNALGNVQGGMIFTIADFAFAVHARAMEFTTVLRHADITYLKPVRGSKLIAKAIPISQGRNMSLYKTELYDDKGVLVAFAMMNGYVFNSTKE
ncbi:MAG: PaaI family thioesterase [Christensenellaceae bacterium]|jgi:acyl-CoA thioesterase|nr:PaaI family thioesterase [Christensenellaceae bacterium]